MYCVNICKSDYRIFMYKENCFFLLEIFLIFNNHFHEFQLQPQLISSKENELLLSAKDSKKSFDNISHLPLFRLSYPTIQSISSNSKNWITQKVIMKRSKNRGMNILKLIKLIIYLSKYLEEWKHIALSFNLNILYLHLGMYNLKEKNRIHKRRSNLEHPIQKMNTDEILTFRRKVSPNCKLGHETFTDKKQVNGME